MNKTIFFLILLVFSVSYSETHITGDITSMILESDGNPYIVEQDLLVPDGKKAVIKEGCVFLFKPFTGLHVQGHLEVEGSQDNPVIFTSINDGEFNSQSEQLPNPFDWNGILVSRESGKVTFSNFSLRFSVYGIKSQNTNIRIENGLFKQNGQFHFTINDKIQYVQDNIPFSYSISDSDESASVKKPKTGMKNKDRKDNVKLKKILRISSLCVGGAGLITTAIFGPQLPKAYSDWDDAAKAEPDNAMREYHDKKKAYQTKLTGTIIGGSFFVLGATGFGISFAF